MKLLKPPELFKRNSLEIVTFNLKAPVRNDILEGRPHTVVPMIMITEGVLNGSQGPLLYPKEELSKTPQVWNYKPIVVYHPTKNGLGASACDPDILNSRKIGVIMNTEFKDGKLKAEAWLEDTRVEAVDNRVSEALAKGEMVEVSTGVFTDNELIEGEWNGEKYFAIARNYRPDHLAVLPDQIGACSIEDGAGLLRLNQGSEKNPRYLRRMIQKVGALEMNELSHSNIRSALGAKIREKHGDDSWIEDIYDNFLIFEMDGHFFRQSYTESENLVELVEGVVEVVRVTEWRKLDGTFVGNEVKEIVMERKEAVDKLIKNSEWTEDERELLEGMEDSAFEGIVKNEEAVAERKAAAEKTEVEAAAEKGAKDVSTPPAEETAENKEETVEEYIAKAPEGLRDVLNSGIQAHNAMKTELINAITANEKNVFTPEVLQTKTMEELRGIAALAAKPEEAPAVVNSPLAPAPVYAPQGSPSANAIKVEPLPVPVLNFDSEKSK